jgi:hypothetical protein
MLVLLAKNTEIREEKTVIQSLFELFSTFMWVGA